MANKCPSEIGSITSEFSVIPDMNIDDDGESVPMSASFFNSSSMASSFSSPSNQVNIESVDGGKNGSIRVKFNVAAEFVSETSDRLVIYRSGFTSTKDFLCYKWIPVPLVETPRPSDSENGDGLGCPLYAVEFDSGALASGKEDQTYQVCYLTKGGHLAGASKPFKMGTSKDCGTEGEVDSLAKNVLCLRVRELMRENEALSDQLKQRASKVGREHKIEEALVTKETEAANAKIEIAELTDKMASLVMQMNSLREEGSLAEEKLRVSKERESVLAKDNQDLKDDLENYKAELTSAVRKLASSERVSMNLSQQLQASSVELKSLAAVNAKLSKKVKRLRRIVRAVEGADGICDSAFNDDDLNVCPENPRETLVASSITSSQSLTDSVCLSLQSKIDEISTKLNRQSAEMQALKGAVLRGDTKNDRQTAKSRLGRFSVAVSTEDIASDVELGALSEPKLNNAAVQAVASDLGWATQSDHQASGPCEPSAPLLPGSLPEPLQPEATPTARQAAILREFGVASQNGDRREGNVKSHDSDSEDYHSTGDDKSADEQDEPVELKCPLCGAVFAPDQFEKLEDHIDLHMDKLCPVCSLGFPKGAKQEDFEEHVQSHFPVEDDLDAEEPEEDVQEQPSSGLWGIAKKASSLLEFD